MAVDVELIEPLGIALGPAWRVRGLADGLRGVRPVVGRGYQGDPRSLLTVARWYAVSEQPGLAIRALDRLVGTKNSTERERAEAAVLRAAVLSGFSASWAEHPGDAWGIVNAIDPNVLSQDQSRDDGLSRILALLADGRMGQALEELRIPFDQLQAGIERAVWRNTLGLWHLKVGDGLRAAAAFTAALEEADLPVPAVTRLRINLASARLLEGEAVTALQGYRDAARRLRHEQFGARTRGILAFNAAVALARHSGPGASRLALRRAEQAIWLLDAAQGVRAEQIWAQLLVAQQLRALGRPEAADAFGGVETLADDANAAQVVAHIDVVSGERRAASAEIPAALDKLIPALLLAMSGRYDVPGLSSRAALLRIRVEPLFERVLSLAHASGRDQLASELIAFHRGAAVRDVATSTGQGADASRSRPAPPVVINQRCELDAHIERASRRYGLRRSELVGQEALTLAGEATSELEDRPAPPPTTLINTLKGRVAFAPPGQDTLVLEPHGDGRFWLQDGLAPQTEVVTINGVRISIRSVGPQRPPTTLPEPEEGVLYLVSQVVARALAGRRDLVYPYYVDKNRSFASGLARATLDDGNQA